MYLPSVSFYIFVGFFVFIRNHVYRQHLAQPQLSDLSLSGLRGGSWSPQKEENQH